MNACPKCGSTEAHKASVVHASQTSSVNATTVGGGVGLGGAVGLGVAGTSGTSPMAVSCTSFSSSSTRS